ncbi:MAG TPA: chemotaxis protein CheX [Candidatus Krumholzibacteria bacterium]|nr:chemotaxis protein CheX [Candidatus Krumholzibacteria bacterium]HRX49934.1 chemotaxis protein CheX [Candidatus Krumholzibacteria bacterium]
MTLTAQIEKLGNPPCPFDPKAALMDAVSSFVETCDVQFEQTYELTEEMPDLDAARCGSSISLTNDQGGMILAILCDQETGESLTRLLFALEEDEDVPLEDMADALNEIVNVAAGVFKALRAEAGQPLNLGLPLYLEGGNSIKFIRSGTKDQSRLIRHPDGTSIQVHLIWQEGTGK